MASVNQHTSCVLCSSNNLSEFSGYKKVDLARCLDCGFVFFRQIPTKKELMDYYGNSYERTSYLSPITITRYNQLLDQFEKVRKTNRLLEIGAGYGFFLEIARQRGWEVYGTELTNEAVEHCQAKGLNVRKGEVIDLEYNNEEFDVIVAIEVIEHLNQPNEYIQKAHELLRSGGKFYITTPNFNSFLRYRLKGNYDIIEYPNHLCYYTRKTLKKMFDKNNFVAEYITTTGISLTRYRTSKGKSNQEYVSETSDDEIMRYRIENSSFLRGTKRITNGLLNLFKIGDSLKGSFIKR